MKTPNRSALAHQITASAPVADASPTSTRLPYVTPRAAPLGEWTVLTLAGSSPVSTVLPLFGK